MTRRVAVEAIADAGIEGADLDGDRDHQPARDGRRLGPAPPASRVHRALVWQDRRTAGALRRAASRPGTSRSSASAPGWSIDPYFSGTKIEWLLRQRRGGARRRLRHDRLLARSSSSPAATSPTTRTPRGRCCSTSAGCAGTPSSADCSGSIRSALPEPLPVRRGLRRRRADFGGEVPVAGIAGDQQAALFGQALPRARGWRRTPTAPAASCCSTPAPRRRRRATGC